MLKKALFVVAVVAILGVVAQAGEIKEEGGWPFTPVYTPVEIPDLLIPVKMDIGYWVHIKNQKDLKNNGIKMTQDSIHTYSGCADVIVECNFKIKLIPEIGAPEGETPIGKFSASFNPAIIEPTGATTSLCATLTEANLKAYTGGTSNVTVAYIKIYVVPAP
jgi:hypothetical protein